MTKAHPFQDLQALASDLRDPEKGCAWTKAQDFKSLMPLTLEEVYELEEAILNNDQDAIREELGDLLYHLVLYSQIASEQGWFSFEDIGQVMLRKHEQRMPKKEERVSLSAEEANAHWQAQKRKKRQEGDLFKGIPYNFPAMMSAFQIQDKASLVGFDWPSAREVLAKIREEIDEIEVELEKDDKLAAEKECGDLLFAVINLIRKSGGHPESALAGCNQRFRERLYKMVEMMRTGGKSWEDYTLSELEELWVLAKKVLA